MPDLHAIPGPAWFIFALFLTAGCTVYARVARHLQTAGGRVRSTAFDLPELLMSIVIASFFALMMISALQREAKGEASLEVDSVLPSSLIFVLFSAGILGFLRFARRLPIVQVFGLDQARPLHVFGWAAGLLLAAFPLTGVANALTLVALQNKFEPQPLIQLFTEVARQNDHLSVAKIFFAGVIVAPICEEFLFRGFFYGVWKRYLGPVAAGLLSCLLFAAFHTSLPALGGLFVLAVCLNLAYERTGSLLVPIGMHALFNFTSLAFLYAQAQMPPTS